MVSSKHLPASKKDKLATIKKDKLVNQAMLHTSATLVPVLHTVPNQAMLDPVQDTVSNPAMLHTSPKMDPVQDTVPNPATLHTLAKALIMEDLHSFSCLPLMKHCQALLLLHQGGDRGREEEGEARGGGDQEQEGQHGGGERVAPPVSFPSHLGVSPA